MANTKNDIAASGIGLTGQVFWNAGLGAAGALATTAINSDGTASAQTYLLNAAEGATLGAIAGRFGGKGTATKHLTNSFRRVLSNKNWSYYFTQIKTQAVRDGLAAIPGILRATIPTVSKSFLKFATQR